MKDLHAVRMQLIKCQYFNPTTTATTTTTTTTTATTTTSTANAATTAISKATITNSNEIVVGWFCSKSKHPLCIQAAKKMYQ